MGFEAVVTVVVGLDSGFDGVGVGFAVGVKEVEGFGCGTTSNNGPWHPPNSPPPFSPPWIGVGAEWIDGDADPLEWESMPRPPPNSGIELMKY